MQPEVIVTQSCGRCKQVLPSTEFSPSCRGRNGFWCKPCMAADRRGEAAPLFTPLLQQCEHCESMYEPKQLRPSRYCSRACKDAAHTAERRSASSLARVGLKCASRDCDVDISQRRGNAKYCSKACRNRDRRPVRTPELRRKYRLSSKYGMTPADYDRMIEEQDGRCAICQRSEPNTKYGMWAIDHCHVTNKVRSLLCGTCNSGIGLFGDDPDRLRKAAAYVKGHAN